MAKKKSTKTSERQKWELLTSCRNNKTGKTYEAGDIVTTADFPKAVLDNWTSITPPAARSV